MLLSLPICVMSFTGSLFLSASPTELLHLYGGAFLVVLHPTCLILVDLSLTSQLVDLCVLQKGELLVPRAHTTIRQRRAFSIVGPSIWNGLPLDLRLMPRLDSRSFYKYLKSHFLAVARLGAPLSRSHEE